MIQGRLSLLGNIKFDESEHGNGIGVVYLKIKLCMTNYKNNGYWKYLNKYYQKLYASHDNSIFMRS